MRGYTACLDLGDKLAAYLLYWDYIGIVDVSDGWGMSFEGEAHFLHQTGVLKTINANRGQSVYQALEALEREDPGVWSVAENAAERKESDVADRSLLVRLHDVMPIPDHDVPLSDILIFRERRRAERQALRHHIERVFQAVLSAPDRPLAFLTEYEALASAVRDCLAVADEAGFRPKLAGCEGSLKWEFSPHLPLGGAGLGLALGDIRAAIAGAVAGLVANLVPKIEVNARVALTPDIHRDGPFAYALLVRQEL